MSDENKPNSGTSNEETGAKPMSISTSTIRGMSSNETILKAINENHNISESQLTKHDICKKIFDNKEEGKKE